MARALVAKRNPVIDAVRAEGEAHGVANAVVALLVARGVPLDRAARDQILGERDLARLERWVVLAITCASVDELLSKP